MVYEGEARVSFNRHVLQSGEVVLYPFFYPAKHGRGMNLNNAKRGMDNRLKIIKAIRELCDINGCTTLKAIMARSKLSIKSVKNGLKVLIDNGVVFVSPQKEWHGAKVYLLVNRNIKPKKKGKHKWY
jgi:predicted transcriptional regulator